MHRNEYRRMAHEEVEEIFREILPQAGMKVREEQITLCHQMLSSLCGNKIALCDAAVGVGKTYAYLVACILFRKYSQLLSGYFSMCGQSQPIVISTSSIALQEAIQREYIPFLSQVLLKKGIISAPIQAVIRKGKEHFVCDNRLELRLDAVRRKAKNPLQREALYALREQYDMDSVQHLSGFDRRMVCVPKYCPETCEMRTYCRYQKYLKEATDEKVFIQICNHNYLLADTLHRANDFRPLLRNYQALIIDEAHKFPEAARQMYGKSFGPEDFMEICSLLEGEHYTHIAAKLREAFSQLFESLPRPQGVLEEQARFRFVLNRESRQALRNSIRWLQRAEDLLIGNLSRWTKNRLEESREVLLQFLNVDRNNILFLEYTSKGLPVFCTVHRKTESLIKADIWERGFPAILTSGTLKAGESFQRSEQLNGLEDVGRVREYQADSPFDYDENCLLYMPRRKRKVYDSYHGEIRFLSEQIRKLVCSTFGHTLVLFTSYSMMGNVYRELRGNLPFPLLKVWKDSQSVIREFKAQKNCVLFAAGSCWEGVDFPGDVVSSLIIVRLPFAVPDPVREAERERYQTLKEYIQKIIVPDMQIKLRQGFGRAIRTETDTCVDATIKRLNSHIFNMDEQIARALIVHQLLGTRISDTLTLRMDCLREKEGRYFVRIDQVKSITYEKAVSNEVGRLILKAMEYTKERYGETEYVFVKKDDPTKPYQYGMIQAQVMRMIRQKDIRDDNGELLKFGTHIFRHCYGKKLTELHIEDWMIARLLGHKTLQSVHHYRRIGNKVMADETRKTREKMDLILMDIIKGWDGYEL